MQEQFPPRKEGKKRLLQKIAKVTSIICFLIAFPCGIYTVMIEGNENEVLKASMGAIAFFFFTVGVVLKAMADSNLPDLTIGENDQQQTNNKD